MHAHTQNAHHSHSVSAPCSLIVPPPQHLTSHRSPHTLRTNPPARCTQIGIASDQAAHACPHSQAVTAFAPELDALFRSVIFSYTVWSNKPTPGAMFQNLIYSSSAGSGAWSMRPAPLTRRQRVLHAMLYVVVPYCWTRAGGALGAWGWGSTGEGGWRKRAWRAYVGAEATMRHATLVNFLLFIANGRYRTMSDRVVGARFMHIDAGMARSLSLDYVGYFLAWQGFTGLLSFLHPIVSAHAGSVKRRIIRAAGLTTTAVRGVVAAGACHECGASPANSPHVPGACGHVHCYYCLRANMMAQPGEYRCGGCGAVATQCAPATREQMEGGAGGGPREAVAAD